MNEKKYAALCSGGKDSTLALKLALAEGLDVTYLLTMVSENEESYMYHTPNLHLMDLFSEACGIPLIRGLTDGIKEEEVSDMEEVISGLDIDGIVVGAVESRYQKTRIEKVCRNQGLKAFLPLWNYDHLELMNSIARHFESYIVSVSAEGLEESYLLRRIDRTLIEDLLKLNKRYGVHLCGEGGEYETLVVDAPFFAKKIDLLETEKVWDGMRGELRVIEARLIEKYRG